MSKKSIEFKGNMGHYRGQLAFLVGNLDAPLLIAWDKTEQGWMHVSKPLTDAFYSVDINVTIVVVVDDGSIEYLEYTGSRHSVEESKNPQGSPERVTRRVEPA